MNNFSYRILCLTAISILVGQGCSTARSPGGSVPVEDQSSTAAGIPETSGGSKVPGGPQTGASPGSQSRAVSPAVVALLDTARLDMDAGRPESAAATLERALRLEPKNGVLWHRLALVRRHQGQWQQVLSLAQKSNSLAAGDRNIQLQNWRLIAVACEHLDDDEGAKRAKMMIKKLNERISP